MPYAAFIGKSIGFTDYYNSVFIEKEDGSARVIPNEVFDELYLRINPLVAALKEDCIEYVVNDPTMDVMYQPEWYIETVEDGYIYEECGSEFFIDTDGNTYAVAPGSVIMRNLYGELRYMEMDEFTKYFDIPGSEFIE